MQGLAHLLCARMLLYAACCNFLHQFGCAADVWHEVFQQLPRLFGNFNTGRRQAADFGSAPEADTSIDPLFDAIALGESEPARLGPANTVKNSVYVLVAATA